MVSFEETVIQKANQKPKLWLRYVDDVLVVWPHERDKLDDFLMLLN